ncbi:MAG: acetoin utilization protein AcuC [Actinomycetota bacterium]|nr:acetoin utilization protein AcuC [Actinomycetota bacterium]
MSDRVGLVFAPQARTYDLGPEHPLRPERVLLTWSLIQAYGLDQLPTVVTLDASEAPDATIELVHTREYVEATRAAGHGVDGPWGRFGFGPGDNPIFDQMHEGAALVVGASVAAAQAVWEGSVEHAFNAAGGLHHAMPARASGFCVYDDPAIAIAWLLEHGAARVAYIDVDVHHGDGPQTIFYDDPRVLTASIHQKAPWFFPGTGDATETGGLDAPGSAVNAPLPPGTDDDEWLAAFRSTVLPAVGEFRPEVLVTQLGCDTHTTDPLAQMELTTRAYRSAARDLHELAHVAARGRWVATGGGGYQWASVVPRAWTVNFAEMAGALDTLAPDLPRSFVEEAAALAGRVVPDRLDDP